MKKGSPHESELEADPRIELVAALEAVSGRNPCPRDEDSDYLTSVRKQLPPGHEACRMYQGMGAPEWRHRHPSLILLDFGPPPGLEVRAHAEHYEGHGQADALARFMPALRTFAPSFMSVWELQAAKREEMFAPARREFAKFDYLGPLLDYMGPLPPHRYHFVIAPLYHGPAMHNVLYRKDGRFEIYSISGHDGVEGRVPVLSFNRRDMAHTAWHEVAHTVVDDWTKELRSEFEPLSSLYALMTGTAANKYKGPQGWLHMVDEHVIRALTSRLDGLVFGEEWGRRALEQERRDGFALVGPVYELLIEYERARGKYPTLRDFYPRFAQLFKRLHEGMKGRAQC